MMKLLSIAVVAGALSGSIAAYAAERSISQKDKAFSETEVTLKVGDTINFVNDDTVVHNIVSSSAGNSFNFGAQAPGSSTTYTFKSAGDVDVVCAIHPKMKLKVTVTN